MVLGSPPPRKVKVSSVGCSHKGLHAAAGWLAGGGPALFSKEVSIGAPGCLTPPCPTAYKTKPLCFQPASSTAALCFPSSGTAGGEGGGEAVEDKGACSCQVAWSHLITWL